VQFPEAAEIETALQYAWEHDKANSFTIQLAIEKMGEENARSAYLISFCSCRLWHAQVIRKLHANGHLSNAAFNSLVLGYAVPTKEAT